MVRVLIWMILGTSSGGLATAQAATTLSACLGEQVTSTVSQDPLVESTYTEMVRLIGTGEPANIESAYNLLAKLIRSRSMGRLRTALGEDAEDALQDITIEMVMGFREGK